MPPYHAIAFKIEPPLYSIVRMLVQLEAAGLDGLQKLAFGKRYSTLRGLRPEDFLHLRGSRPLPR